jgi:hypothetical protein
MKKLAALAILLVISGCAATGRWDTGVFPQQYVYDNQVPAPVAGK